jgi:hypothetical protein
MAGRGIVRDNLSTLGVDDPMEQRELVVIARPEAALRARGDEVASASGEDTSSLASILSDAGVTIEPLFGATEERLREETASLVDVSGMAAPDLSLFYRVDAPDEQLDELAERLRNEEVIEAAYVKPPAMLPQGINDMVPLAEEPPASPDFASRQIYLNAAPAGIDARFAWTQPGGRGAGVRIIDIEGGVALHP